MCPVRVARVLFLGCTLAATIALPAQAQVRMAATVGNMHYTLTDLTPDDGVAPYVGFIGQPTASLSSILIVSEEGRPLQTRFGGSSGQAPSVVNRDWVPGVHTTVAFDGANGIAAGRADPVDVGRTTFHNEATLQWNNFVLTPHTRISFKVDAAIDLKLDDGSASKAGGWGAASLALDYPFDGGRHVEDRSMDWLGPDTNGFVDAVQWGRTLAVSWDNAGSSWEYGSLAAVAHVSGEAWGDPVSSVSPVPEPSAWAMLALGCALLAGLRRTKQP